MRDEPVVVYAYGWGQIFRLYTDSCEANGVSYELKHLLSVQPAYHHFLGVHSAQLILRFKEQTLVLRGIAEVELARKAVAYLETWINPEQEEIVLHTKESFRVSPMEEDIYTDDAPASIIATPITPTYSSTNASASTRLTMTSTDEIHNKHGVQEIGEIDEEIRDYAQASTTPIEIPPVRRVRVVPYSGRLRSIHAQSVGQERRIDAERLAQRLQTETLPHVPVPLRLLVGEYAHYTAEATLCGEPLGEALQYSYTVKDQGMLILTNRRMIYIGRRSQIVMEYARCLHVSRVRGMIAFRAEHWNKREFFEVRRPLECTVYLECILQRYAQDAEYDEEAQWPSYHQVI